MCCFFLEIETVEGLIRVPFGLLILIKLTFGALVFRFDLILEMLSLLEVKGLETYRYFPIVT